jgi:membrane-bound lytic murein transglycosylase D
MFGRIAPNCARRARFFDRLRGAQTPFGTIALVCAWVGWPAVAHADLGGASSTTPGAHGGSHVREAENDPDRTRVGPIDVSMSGRRRVRGGRPEGASILVAWGPEIDDPDRADRRALAAFERASFPRARSFKTIVDQPPQAWMRALDPPSLPIRWNRRTIEYLEYFKTDPRGHAMMRAWIRRGGRYEERLRKILREVGIPEDLVMVALAESGFNPTVRSRVGAAGLWQFMEGTGAVYGLERDYWIDERFDVEKSTYAAALFLADLHVRFGSWELALAAFNAGYGLVLTAIERHNTNNYWALCEIESGLPYATTNYVPKIMAAALVSANRHAFAVGPDQVSPDPSIDWVEVRVPRSTPLAKLAAAIDVEPALLEELNAHLIRKRTPPTRGGHPVRIPRDALAAFERAPDALRKDWSLETTYRARDGETLGAIASAHGISERALRSLNGVIDAAEVSGGVTLVVPATASGTLDTRRVEPPLAAVPPIAVPHGMRRVFFVATRAATPLTLERAFGVRWSQVVEWNDLDPHARLQPDQVLQILVPVSFDEQDRAVEAWEDHEVELVVRGSTPHIEAALRRRGLVRRGYRVKAGDTLGRIGRRFGLTDGDLARINGFPRTRDPDAGEVVVVYVPESKLKQTIDAPDVHAAPRTAGRTPSTRDTARVPGAVP